MKLIVRKWTINVGSFTSHIHQLKFNPTSHLSPQYHCKSHCILTRFFYQAWLVVYFLSNMPVCYLLLERGSNPLSASFLVSSNSSWISSVSEVSSLLSLPSLITLTISSLKEPPSSSTCTMSTILNQYTSPKNDNVVVLRIILKQKLSNLWIFYNNKPICNVSMWSSSSSNSRNFLHFLFFVRWHSFRRWVTNWMEIFVLTTAARILTIWVVVLRQRFITTTKLRFIWITE